MAINFILHLVWFLCDVKWSPFRASLACIFFSIASSSSSSLAWLVIMPTLSVDVFTSAHSLCVWSTLWQHQYDIKWKINYLRTVYHRLPWELAIHISVLLLSQFLTYVNALSFTLLTSERSFLRLVCLSVLSVRSLTTSPVAEWVAISSALYYPEDRAGVLFISVFSESTVAFVCSVRIIELNPYWGITFLMHAWILMGNSKERRNKEEQEGKRRQRGEKDVSLRTDALWF